MDIISVRDLDVGYGRTAVLRGMNFAIAQGRITAVVGASGSGKSTLLKTLIGLLSPLAGEVRLSGERIDFDSERSLRTLYRRAAVRAMLGRVGLHDCEAKYPFELSGGMRKRAALARAMILEPDLILCDEPSAGLDPITSAGLDELLIELRTGHGVTFVVVTHELRSIARIADRVLVLRDGRIHYDGDYADLLRSDDPYLREFFLRKSDHDH
jgi:phospholipid/cholesterol/gamma-HCH transport system ATP-binding protein